MCNNESLEEEDLDICPRKLLKGVNWLVTKGRIERNDGRQSADEGSGSMGVAGAQFFIGGDTCVLPRKIPEMYSKYLNCLLSISNCNFPHRPEIGWHTKPFLNCSLQSTVCPNGDN